MASFYRTSVIYVSYIQDMMTFGGIEEKVVTLDEARAEQEAELLLAGIHEDDSGPATAGQRQDATAPAAPSRDVPTPAAVVPADKKRPASDGGVPPGTTENAEADRAAAKGDAVAGSTPKKNNNTSVYVMGIPDDATEDEIAEEFARCGIIKQDADNNPRIKIYKCALMPLVCVCSVAISMYMAACGWCFQHRAGCGCSKPTPGAMGMRTCVLQG